MLYDVLFQRPPRPHLYIGLLPHKHLSHIIRYQNMRPELARLNSTVSSKQALSVFNITGMDILRAEIKYGDNRLANPLAPNDCVLYNKSNYTQLNKN